MSPLKRIVTLQSWLAARRRQVNNCANLQISRSNASASGLNSLYTSLWVAGAGQFPPCPGSRLARVQICCLATATAVALLRLPAYARDGQFFREVGERGDEDKGNHRPRAHFFRPSHHCSGTSLLTFRRPQAAPPKSKYDHCQPLAKEALEAELTVSFT